MSQTVVLLWLSASINSAADFRPSESQRADARAWAAAQKIALEAERPNSPRPAFKPYDGALADRIEAWLDQARSAAGALEESSALELLSQVETSLRDHPELPQAAWLMAEHYQILADVRAQSPDSAAEADQLRARAEVLEGARSATFSEQARAASTSAAAPARFPITLQGADSGDRIEWNGEHVAPLFETSAGEHHVRVLRRGKLLFAAFAQVAAGATTVSIGVPALVPCSRDDLEGARVQNYRVVARPGTRCQSWALARPAPGGGIDVARCSGERCDALSHFERSRKRAAGAKAKPVTTEGGWPAWASYTVLGVTALGATGLVLWQTGAFESTPETRTTWEFQGLESAAFRF